MHRCYGTANFEKDVERALPATDDATRARVLDRLMGAYGVARAAQGTRELREQLERTMGDPAQWAPGELEKLRSEIDGAVNLFERQRGEFACQMDSLSAEVDEITARIARFERRRTRIRMEIERYFGD